MMHFKLLLQEYNVLLVLGVSVSSHAKCAPHGCARDVPHVVTPPRLAELRGFLPQIAPCPLPTYVRSSGHERHQAGRWCEVQGVQAAGVADPSFVAPYSCLQLRLEQLVPGASALLAM